MFDGAPPAVLPMPKKNEKKRDDKSAKIDSWVLYMVETIVRWRRQTQPGDEKLTAAEYISEMVRSGAAEEFKKAAHWTARQNDKGPAKPKPDTETKA